MSRTLGTNEAPPATRATAPGWQDPRLWIGVAIVAFSVLVGSRLLDGADRTVPVWAVAEDLSAGDTVTADDLVAHRVRFADDDTLGRYLRADEALPQERELLTGLSTGELVPRSALGAQGGSGIAHVPVWAPADAVPPGVRAGSIVDVWSAATNDTPAARLMDDVAVIDAPSAGDAFGASGTRQLVLGVPAALEEELQRTITATTSGGVHIVKQG